MLLGCGISAGTQLLRNKCNKDSNTRNIHAKMRTLLFKKKKIVCCRECIIQARTIFEGCSLSLGARLLYSAVQKLLCHRDWNTCNTYSVHKTYVRLFTDQLEMAEGKGTQ